MIEKLTITLPLDDWKRIHELADAMLSQVPDPLSNPEETVAMARAVANLRHEIFECTICEAAKQRPPGETI